jgi:hypothetical protein
MAAREALAARLDHKTLWPREKRWLLDFITKRNAMAAREALAARLDHKTLWPREKHWLLGLITKRY